MGVLATVKEDVETGDAGNQVTLLIILVCHMFLWNLLLPLHALLLPLELLNHQVLYPHHRCFGRI